ncbi:unnamed protein product [Agarophyton chilense]
MASHSSIVPFANDDSDITLPQFKQHGSFDANQHADQLIKRLHEHALTEYRITKKRTQQELASKIMEARRSGDRSVLKTQKKKVANHASAVASRVKREYIVSSFECLLKEKVMDSYRLSDVVCRQAIIMADKDDQIRRLNDKIIVLCQQVNAFSSVATAAPINNVPPLAQASPACAFSDDSEPFALWPHQQSDLDALLTHGAFHDAVKSDNPPCACCVTSYCAQGAEASSSHDAELIEAGVSKREYIGKENEAKMGVKTAQHLPSRQNTVRHGLLADGVDVSFNPGA